MFNWIQIFKNIKRNKQIFELDSKYDVTEYTTDIQRAKQDINDYKRDILKNILNKKLLWVVINILFICLTFLLIVIFIACLAYYLGSKHDTNNGLWITAIIIGILYTIFLIYEWIYNSFYLKKLFIRYFSTFNQMLNKNVISSKSRAFPNAIRMCFYWKNPGDWKFNANNSYPDFNYWICLEGLATFFDKLRTC